MILTGILGMQDAYVVCHAVPLIPGGFHGCVTLYLLNSNPTLCYKTQTIITSKQFVFYKESVF